MYSWWKNFVIFRIQFNWRAKIGKKPGIPSNRYRQQCRKDKAGVDQYLRIFALHAIDMNLRIAQFWQSFSTRTPGWKTSPCAHVVELVFSNIAGRTDKTTKKRRHTISVF